MTKAKAPKRAATSRPTPTPNEPDLPMGSTGQTHPSIGLGLWALGRWTSNDEKLTRATIERSVERRVRWYDTAEVYGAGRSERVLGDVLGTPRPGAAGPFVATKLSWEHLRKAQVRPALIGSLQRLGRTNVDLYLVHAPDPHVPIAETMGALEELWAEGRTKALGVSNFSVEELEAARAALGRAEIVVNQVRFNLLDRADGEPLQEYCRQHRIVLEAYSPLARGLLAGRYLDGGPVPTEVRRFADQPLDADRFNEILRQARALRDLARRAKVPMASIALHWLRREGAAPVFGASRPEQLDQVLDAWATRPTDEVLDAAQEIVRGPA